jgi:hypothetical protein
MNPTQTNNTNTTIDPKALAQAEQALENAMARVAGVLTDEDLQIMEQLDSSDETGEQLKGFIMSKVPNFQAILEEETINVLRPKNP